MLLFPAFIFFPPPPHENFFSQAFRDYQRNVSELSSLAIGTGDIGLDRSGHSARCSRHL